VNGTAVRFGGSPKTLDPALLAFVACAVEQITDRILDVPVYTTRLLLSLPGIAKALTQATAAMFGVKQSDQDFIDNVMAAHAQQSYLVLLGRSADKAFGTGGIKDLKLD
jgi:hypothetical protein